MLENLTMLLYRFPAFFRELGAIFYRVSGFGLIAGAFAQVGKLAASAATGMAGQPPVADIAQLLPGLWTGWVPESAAGVIAYVTLGIVGAVLAFAAKDVQHQLRFL